MRELSDLPMPKSDKRGWPWRQVSGFQTTEEIMPKISIVTPSYNQGEYLEATIRSVLLQGYPNLEYIIIDGGSTDDSVSIIQKYDKWIEWWVSEEDGGQAEAINKGFRRATGDIYAYINSDDFYLPNALSRVASDYHKWSGSSIYGYPVVTMTDQKVIRVGSVPNCRSGSCVEKREGEFSEKGERWRGSIGPWLLGDYYLDQPGVFWDASVFENTNGFDVTYDYVFDHKFLLEQLLTGVPLIVFGGKPIACFRLHEESKSVVSRDAIGGSCFSRELWEMAMEYESELPHEERVVVRRIRQNRLLGVLWKRLSASDGTGRVLRELIRYSIKDPTMFGKRFYWGTVRRTVVATWMNLVSRRK